MNREQHSSLLDKWMPPAYHIDIFTHGNITLKIDMKTFIRIMKALSDPNRVKAIKLLEQKELCVCELTALLGLAQPTVSKHLKNLEDAGLVESRREGSWVNYRLATGEESVYAEAMLENLADWLDDDRQIQDVLARLPQVDRERICAA
jgi:ArsR family transcriptional regulator